MEINLNEIPAEVRQAKQRFGIVGNSPLLITGVQRAIQVAPIDLSVLITGESGTGKEFFPRIIHQYSSRRHNRYIAVNCGAIPEGTIDSELFGHEKGAFTGAIATRKGYFEEADGGTIFLDEVGELPLPTQARLLRVLETGEFMKVGSSTVQKTNVRIVAATNVDMPRAIEEGKFREDLFYRLSTVGIDVPPLRDRGSDITLLARKFAADFSEKYRMPAVTFTADAYTALEHYRWPGNVRQLKNIIEQIGLFEAGNKVDTAVLEQYLPKSSMVYAPALKGDSHTRHALYEEEREVLFNMVFRLRNELDQLRGVVDALTAGKQPTGRKHPLDSQPLLDYHLPVHDYHTGDEPHDIETVEAEEAFEKSAPENPQPLQPDNNTAGRPLTLEENEKRMIRDSLEKNGGVRKAAAKELNISERTLYRKIKEYGLE